MESSDRPIPFATAMTEAMATQHYTTRKLRDATRQAGLRGGKGLSHAYIGAIRRGDDPPSVEAMEVIASILGFNLAQVAEYQLAAARRDLDEREVGYDEALTTLEQLSRARRELFRASEVPEAPPSTLDGGGATPGSRRAAGAETTEGGSRRGP